MCKIKLTIHITSLTHAHTNPARCTIIQRSYFFLLLHEEQKKKKQDEGKGWKRRDEENYTGMSRVLNKRQNERNV